MPILLILVGVVVEETTASILEMHKSEKSNRGMEKENMKKKKKREKNILIGCRLAKVGKASAILTEVNGCGAVDIYAQFFGGINS